MYYHLISCTGNYGCTIYTCLYCTISRENNCFNAYIKNMSSQWLYLCSRRCVVQQQDPGISIISGLICSRLPSSEVMGFLCLPMHTSGTLRCLQKGQIDPPNSDNGETMPLPDLFSSLQTITEHQ